MTDSEIRMVCSGVGHTMDNTGERKGRSKDFRMTEKRLCRKCGAELTDVGSERLCPACLLEGGLERGESVAEKPPWAVPLSSRSAQETAVFYSFGDYELLEEISR